MEGGDWMGMGNNNDQDGFTRRPDKRPMLPSSPPLSPTPFEQWEEPYWLIQDHDDNQDYNDYAELLFGTSTDDDRFPFNLAEGETERPLFSIGDKQNAPYEEHSPDLSSMVVNPISPTLTTLAEAGTPPPSASATAFVASASDGNPGRRRGGPGRPPQGLDPNMDPVKFKRIISNRLSARKSRRRRIQYVTGIETKVKAYEAQIALLLSGNDRLRNHCHFLEKENERLKGELWFETNRRILREAEIEATKTELNRLRKLQPTQQQPKNKGQAMVPSDWGNYYQRMMIPNMVQPAGMGQMMSFNPNEGLVEETKGDLNSDEEQEWMLPSMRLLSQQPTVQMPLMQCSGWNSLPMEQMPQDSSFDESHFEQPEYSSMQKQWEANSFHDGGKSTEPEADYWK